MANITSLFQGSHKQLIQRVMGESSPEVPQHESYGSGEQTRREQTIWRAGSPSTGTANLQKDNFLNKNLGVPQTAVSITQADFTGGSRRDENIPPTIQTVPFPNPKFDVFKNPPPVSNELSSPNFIGSMANDIGGAIGSGLQKVVDSSVDIAKLTPSALSESPINHAPITPEESARQLHNFQSMLQKTNETAGSINEVRRDREAAHHAQITGGHQIGSVSAEEAGFANTSINMRGQAVYNVRTAFGIYEKKAAAKARAEAQHNPVTLPGHSKDKGTVHQADNHEKADLSLSQIASEGQSQITGANTTQ